MTIAVGLIHIVTTGFKRYKMKRAYGSKLRKTIDTVRAVGSANVVITDFSPLGKV